MAIDFKLFYNVGVYLICFANFENSTYFFDVIHFL
jgi:hypothetical protein